MLLPSVSPGELPSRRDLLLQALLHLPRIANPDGTVSTLLAEAEINTLHERRRKELAPLRALAEPPARIPTLDQLKVVEMAADDAEPILTHFHYLRSFREDSSNVGALFEGRIVAVCSVSELDLPMVAAKLPIESIEEAAVISRVFAFDWAPRNAVSYLLARTEQLSPLARQARMLLTYVNPNMGFTGSSFRAANWRPIGQETGTRYAYLTGSYITDRQISRLSQPVFGHLEFSTMPLRPLLVLGRFLDRRLSHLATREAQFEVPRQKIS